MRARRQTAGGLDVQCAHSPSPQAGGTLGGTHPRLGYREPRCRMLLHEPESATRLARQPATRRPPALYRRVAEKPMRTTAVTTMPISPTQPPTSAHAATMRKAPSMIAANTPTDRPRSWSVSAARVFFIQFTPDTVSTTAGAVVTRADHQRPKAGRGRGAAHAVDGATAPGDAMPYDTGRPARFPGTGKRARHACRPALEAGERCACTGRHPSEHTPRGKNAKVETYPRG